MLSACALQPLYGGGSSGPVASTLRQVAVAPIPGRDGWLVYNKLKERLGEGGDSAAAYRLEVELDDEIIGLGIRGDRAVDSRAADAARALSAGDGLRPAKSFSTLLPDPMRESTWSVPNMRPSPPSRRAERLADEVANQIVARLALYATRTAESE
jgi:LPS-assembly lipoprotein